MLGTGTSSSYKSSGGTKAQDDYLKSEWQKSQDVNHQYGNATPTSPSGYGPIFAYNSAQQSKASSPVPLPFNPTPPAFIQDPRAILAQQLQDTYMANAATMFAGLDAQKDRLAQHQAELEGAYGARAGAASQGAALANRGVDLDEEKLGVDRKATERQNPYLDELFGLRTGQRNSRNDYLKTLEGLSEREMAAKLFGADAIQEFGLGSADLQQKQLTRKQRSDAAAAGSTVTQGNREALSDIDLEHALTTTKVKKDRELAGKTAQLERERDAAGIKAQWDDNYWSQQLDAATTKEEKAKVGDRLSMLDIAAKELGLKREQIANQLSQTLASMNLDKVTSVGQLLDAMVSNDQKRAEAAWQIFQQAQTDAATLAG